MIANLEQLKGYVVGRGFLGMLVIYCPVCRDMIHFKPILGTLHVCAVSR